MIFGFELAVCILLPAVWFCVVIDFPHQFWDEFYPLRWVVNVAMVAYVWWLWPELSETFTKIRRDRGASR